MTSSSRRRPRTHPGATRFTHIAVWNLLSAVAGQSINLPVHVDPTDGRGGRARRVQARRLPRAGRRSGRARPAARRTAHSCSTRRSPWTTSSPFPAGQSIWKAITTPYGPARSPECGRHRRDPCTGRERYGHARARRSTHRSALVRFSGKVTQAGHQSQARGRPTGQRQVGRLHDAGERDRQLQRRLEEDRQEDNVDVPGAHDRRRARRHDNRVR